MNQNGKFSVDLGAVVGNVSWDTIDDAIAWVGRLLSDWAWIIQGSRKSSQERLRDTVINPLNAVRTRLEQAKSLAGAGGQEKAQQEFWSAGNDLRQMLDQRPWLVQGRHSPQRALIEDVRQRKGDAVAASLLALFLKIDIGRDDNSYVIAQASIEKELFDLGNNRRIDFETKAYEELVKKLDVDREKHLAVIREGIGRSIDQAASFVAEVEGRAKAFEADQSARNNEWRKAVNGANAELQNIKDAYDKHMALAAPVDYWESKQKRHFSWMWVSGLITALCMILAGWLLHCELAAVATNAIASNSSSSTLAMKQEGFVGVLSALATWRLGSFILLATLAFWVLRLLVRIFLSNLHLENDARERVTMVKTYLALIREGSLSSDSENLKAVLAALFRPTGDGIVKDEGIPPNMLELLTKLK